MKDACRASLIEEAKTLNWFHAIDLGDYKTPPRSNARAVPNATLLPVWAFLTHIDVTGKRCLDIGAADGLVSFVLKARGASHVIATDGVRRRTFEIARELLGLDVEYWHDVRDIDLPKRLEPETFDLIVMAGFIYHLFAPLSAIAACRRALKPGGLLIIETVYTGGDEPACFLNTEMDPPLTDQRSTYWVGTPSAIRGMLKLACFDIFASASLGALLTSGRIGRIGFVARSVAPADVNDRTPQLIQTHTKLRGVTELMFHQLHTPLSLPIDYGGPKRHIDCDHLRHPEKVPFLPRLEDYVSL